jgi:hypothetical protein
MSVGNDGDAWAHDSMHDRPPRTTSLRDAQGRKRRQSMHARHTQHRKRNGRERKRGQRRRRISDRRLPQSRHKRARIHKRKHRNPKARPPIPDTPEPHRGQPKRLTRSNRRVTTRDPSPNVSVPSLGEQDPNPPQTGDSSIDPLLVYTDRLHPGVVRP